MKQLSKLVWVTAAAFALVVAMGTLSPASAQNRELGVGYQYLNATTSSTSIPVGWFADFQFPINFPMLSVVGEVTGAYKDPTKAHTFSGGIRYDVEVSGTAKPFVQVLFGGYNSSTDITFLGTTTSVSSTDGVMTIGGGVKFPLSNFTAKVGFDFRRVLATVGSNEIRIIAGLVFPIGG